MYFRCEILFWLNIILNPVFFSCKKILLFVCPTNKYKESLYIDLNRDFIKHPEATFYGRVKGDSMEDAGICHGDIAVIDRSVEPHDGDVVVAYINEEFTIKYLDLKNRNKGYIELRPANKGRSERFL